jgi:molecular chaperone GrpE
MTKREHPGKKAEAEVKAEAQVGAQATAARAPAAELSGEELSDQLRAAEEEARGHYDKLLRVMAEFENFKKRMQREHEDLARFANEKLLADLLPALDDLDRVLDHIPIDASEEVRTIASGIEIVRKALTATLAKYGLQEVAAQAEPFDPARHEAIAAIESEAHPAGTVIAVHRKGYWLADRLLRPAMVTVAKAHEGAPPAGPETQANG